jgi:glycerol uptake facilitator-like aquaporin
MSTFFAGLATFPRAVMYIIAQITGAIVGGYWLKLGLGDAYFPSVRFQDSSDEKPYS